MSKDNVMLAIAVFVVLLVFAPVEIAICKSWRTAMQDAISWDGKEIK